MAEYNQKLSEVDARIQTGKDWYPNGYFIFNGDLECSDDTHLKFQLY